MSFILDALRKSENERKRNELPGLADSRVQQNDKSRKLWIPLVALLVGVNLSLLIVMWLMGDQDSDSPAATAVVATPDVPPIAAPVVVARPAAESITQQYAAPVNEPASRSLLNELEPGSLAPIGTISPNEREPDNPAPINTTSVNTGVATAAPNNVDPAANSGEYIPTLLELTLNNEISLSPLHLDIHVFSENQQERFVFINMSKYREGEFISEGPRITEITKTGVMMSHQGQQFLLLRD